MNATALHAQLHVRVAPGAAACSGQQTRRTVPTARARARPTLHQQQQPVACSAGLNASSLACASGSSSNSSTWGSRQCSTGRRRALVCHAAGSAGTPVRRQLPIFPLGLVALPHAMVPLMIFEPRYRVLFNTLLDGAEGVEDGLVQKDSPFCGTRTFGMCYVDEKGRMGSIGTTLKIEEWVHESDGRIYITSKGVERFRITGVVRDKPVLLCEVEVLPEDEDEGEQAKALKNDVAELFRNTLRLHMKMARRKAQGAGGSISSRLGSAGGAATAGSGAGSASASEVSEEEEAAEPEQLTDLSPCKFSYWIANVFQESRYTQQALLEEHNTVSRLQKEKEVLTSTLKFYSAATALEGVFSTGGSEAGEAAQPPPGGPD